MSDIIETMRGLRNQTITFEAAMSDLTVAIGNVERLTDLQPDQLDRLWKAVARLGNAVATKSENGESQ
jgi:ABC-type transporter Mla subunit MlaD